MFSFIILAICFISINSQDSTDTTILTSDSTETIRQTPNEYLDKVLEEVNLISAEQGLEPYNAFNSQFLNIRFDGELHGLSRWFRKSDAKKTYNAVSKIVEVEADIGLKNLTARLNWTIQMPFFPQSGLVVSSIDEIVTSIRFRVNVDSRIVLVTRFKVASVGKVTSHVKASPIPFMDKITAMVTSAVANMAKNAIAKVVESQVRDLVEDTLNHFAVIGIPF